MAGTLGADLLDIEDSPPTPVPAQNGYNATQAMDDEDGEALTLPPEENDERLDIEEVVEQLAGKL